MLHTQWQSIVDKLNAELHVGNELIKESERQIKINMIQGPPAQW